MELLDKHGAEISGKKTDQHLTELASVLGKHVLGPQLKDAVSALGKKKKQENNKYSVRAVRVSVVSCVSCMLCMPYAVRRERIV